MAGDNNHAEYFEHKGEDIKSVAQNVVRRNKLSTNDNKLVGFVGSL